MKSTHWAVSWRMRPTVAGFSFRRLNVRKGPAVRATRAQTDRSLYRSAVRKMLEEQDNLTFFQQEVDDLVVDADRVTGVVTRFGVRINARSVVLATGTFLGGVFACRPSAAKWWPCRGFAVESPGYQAARHDVPRGTSKKPVHLPASMVEPLIIQG